MTPKRKRLEEMRTLIIAGRLNEREHARLYVEDTDGTKVRLMSDEALPAIERRLAAMEETEAAE